MNAEYTKVFKWCCSLYAALVTVVCRTGWRSLEPLSFMLLLAFSQNVLPAFNPCWPCLEEGYMPLSLMGYMKIYLNFILISDAFMVFYIQNTVFADKKNQVP